MLLGWNKKLRNYLAVAGFTSSLSLPALARANNIIEFQGSRIERIAEFPESPTSNKKIQVRFINLNPVVNAWYLVAIKWPNTSNVSTYHIENAFPRSLLVDLDPAFPQGLTLTDELGQKTQCLLWGSRLDSTLEKSAGVDRYYVELCDGKLFTRRPAVGRETPKELVTDFLRRHVWGGEEITTVVKETFFKDKFLISSELKAASPSPEPSPVQPEPVSEGIAPPPAPLAAEINPDLADRFITPQYLGIDLGTANGTNLEVGKWYPGGRNPGIFVSVVEPRALRKEILTGYMDRARKLDNIELSAVSYLVAFDLEQYDLGFALGTKNPSLEWSDRTLPEVRNNKLPGPDGFAVSDPLILTGSINPIDASRVIATFTGGFKRSHSAFKWGALAKKNAGSHYGFIENGVVFSSLINDLATIIIYNDGRIDLKSWASADLNDIPRIRHARQNGVPLVEWDAVNNRPMPGALVGSWHMGNWSGSQDSAQRALRAGICLTSNAAGKNYLIYGYFSSATPNAMARVFQAYHCRYAFHLDMNALEHTYLALYSQLQSGFSVQHLITGMHVLDRQMKGGIIIPRFVGTADNRDFFYLLKK